MKAILLPVALLALFPFVSAQESQGPLDARHWPDRLLVKLDESYPSPADSYSDVLDGTGVAELDAILQELDVKQVTRVFRQPTKGWANPTAAQNYGLDRWIEVEWAGEVELHEIRGQIAGIAGVERADLSGKGEFLDTTPNDPNYNQQWALANNGITNAPQAWDVLTSSSVIVAVTDSGTQLSHPELKNYWVNPGEIQGNGIDDDGNGFVDDWRGWDFEENDNIPRDEFGHGVHVGGIVGAIGNNGSQVTGVLWDVPVMHLKVGTFILDPADAADAIVYAADNGAQVVNMSFGYPFEQPVLKTAVDYATDLDVVLVAAAGNGGDTTKGWPAAYGKVMAVISTDSSDNRAFTSTYGSWCDIAAPGESILNTFLNDNIATLSGTSMASPFVAGATSMVREVNPSLSARDARWVLSYSAEDRGASGFDNFFGWGRIDLLAAVEKAQSLRLSGRIASPGDSVDITISEPNEPNFLYVLLVSQEGVRPGLPLANNRQIAINYDFVLFPFLFNHPDGLGVFDNFIGALDGQGQATATFNVPMGGTFAGSNVYFAGVTLDPNDLSEVSSITASNTLEVQ